MSSIYRHFGGHVNGNILLYNIKQYYVSYKTRQYGEPNTRSWTSIHGQYVLLESGLRGNLSALVAHCNV